MTHSVRLSVGPSVCRSHLAFLSFFAASAHPHATSVAVYPALFSVSLPPFLPAFTTIFLRRLAAFIDNILRLWFEYLGKSYPFMTCLGVIIKVSTMFIHFPPKCTACVTTVRPPAIWIWPRTPFHKENKIRNKLIFTTSFLHSSFAPAMETFLAQIAVNVFLVGRAKIVTLRRNPLKGKML